MADRNIDHALSSHNDEGPIQILDVLSKWRHSLSSRPESDTGSSVMSAGNRRR